MAFETSGQWLVFLSCLYLGAALYLVYSMLAFVRYVYRNGFFITALCDGIFSAASAISLLFVIVYKGKGALRAYMFLGALLGFFLIKFIFERIALHARIRLDEHQGKAGSKKQKKE